MLAIALIGHSITPNPIELSHWLTEPTVINNTINVCIKEEILNHFRNILMTWAERLMVTTKGGLTIDISIESSDSSKTAPKHITDISSY